MKEHKKRAERHEREAHEAPHVPPTELGDIASAATPAAAGAGAVVEPTDQAVLRLEDEVATLKDRHLRLAAEFDNFRKRAAKERSETWEKAQGDLVLRLVDALDDLARFTRSPAPGEARQLHEGMTLIERKLWKELSGLGVARLDETGVPFDPNVHEAVTTGPATAPEQDHTVGAVLQTGYRLGKQLLRPARVQVLTWSDDGAEA
jgi:molecular chaperone GrpE